MALLLAAFKLSVCHEETRVGHLSSGFAMGIGVLAQFIVPGSSVFMTGSSTKANSFWNHLGFFIPSCNTDQGVLQSGKSNSVKL